MGCRSKDTGDSWSSCNKHSQSLSIRSPPVFFFFFLENKKMEENWGFGTKIATGFVRSISDCGLWLCCWVVWVVEVLTKGGCGCVVGWFWVVEVSAMLVVGCDLLVLVHVWVIYVVCVCLQLVVSNKLTTIPIISHSNLHSQTTNLQIKNKSVRNNLNPHTKK